MRRAAPFLAMLLLAAAARAGVVEATTLAELSRRADAIVVARATGTVLDGVVRMRVEEAVRGSADELLVRAEPGVADDFDPGAAPVWLLFLRATPSGVYAVLGGDRGAVPMADPDSASALEAVRSLAPAADLPDARLRDLLVASLGSASVRVREDAAEDLVRLPAPLRASIAEGRLRDALEREEGETPARAALLRLFASRGASGDLPALLREMESGSASLYPLLAEALRAVPGGAEGAVEALDRLDPSRRARAIELLGRIGAPAALPSLSAALGDPDAGVRAAAIEALGRIPGGAAALFPLLASSALGESRAVARSILVGGSREDREALAALAPSIEGVRAFLAEVRANPLLLVQSKNR